MSKKYLRDLIPLVVICLIAALLLASFNLLTKGPIEENTLRAAEETRIRLLPSAASFEAMELTEDSGMDSCYQGLDENGETVGYVIQTTVNGYGGEVVVTLGMDTDNIITGVEVGGENFSESPGLGALAKEPEFRNQYIGKTVPITLVKGGAAKDEKSVDAISGATITSSAVNGGINLAGKYIADLSGESAPNTASAQGFGGPVAVTLELDDNGAIASIVIGDEYFNETEGYGKRALEESFQSQFIGMTPPLELSDIDAISGATYTSKAVVSAINTVYSQLSGAEVPVPAEDETPAALFFEDGAWRSSARGFGGEVAVKLVLDNLTIQEIEIGDADFAETDGFGSKAREPEFLEQFIGKTLPLADGDVDAIAGATYTSNAVFEAIDAIYQAASDDIPDEPQPVPAEAEPAADAQTSATASVEADAQSGATVAAETAAEPEEEAVPASTSANTYTASADGYGGPVAVTLTLEGTTIVDITIGDSQFNETPVLGGQALEEAFQSQFIGKTLPIMPDDIDAISHATMTTNAVLNAIDEIYQTIEVNAAEKIDAGASVELATYTASADGYGGPVAVTLTLEGTTIVDITIGDDQFNETPGLGAKALEEAFQSQFVGKTLPIMPDDIDAIASATMTTNAVLNAIDEIYQTIEVNAAEKIDAGNSVELATYTASADGYGGPVAVTLTLEGTTIIDITIGDDQFNETPGLGAKALEEAFQSQFIGKTLPIMPDDIDAIASATMTTNAVLNAIDEIYQTIEVNAAEKIDAGASVELATYTASADGYGGPVAVTLTLEGTTIVDITIGDDKFNETPGLGAKALEEAFQSQFVGKTLPIMPDDIDAIASATMTTNAVLEAIGQIYDSIKD